MFWIRLSDCSDAFGYRYAAPGWHPFTEAISRDVRKGVDYHGSFLEDFYRRSAGMTAADALFIDSEDAPRILTDRPAGTPPWIWFEDSRVGERVDFGARFGPVTEHVGRLKLQRLRNADERIKQHGYRPGVNPDGFVRGFLLAAPPILRFVVTGGNHRVAAIASRTDLPEEILVRFDPRFPEVVSVADVARWPAVVNGSVSEVEARSVVAAFLADNDLEHRAKLGFE
jgi:hypothetical protein